MRGGGWGRLPARYPDKAAMPNGSVLGGNDASWNAPLCLGMGRLAAGTVYGAMLGQDGWPLIWVRRLASTLFSALFRTSGFPCSFPFSSAVPIFRSSALWAFSIFIWHRYHLLSLCLCRLLSQPNDELRDGSRRRPSRMKRLIPRELACLIIRSVLASVCTV